MKIQVIFEQNVDDSVHQTEFPIFEDPSDHLFSKNFQMINQSFSKNCFISISMSWKNYFRTESCDERFVKTILCPHSRSDPILNHWYVYVRSSRPCWVRSYYVVTVTVENAADCPVPTVLVSTFIESVQSRQSSRYLWTLLNRLSSPLQNVPHRWWRVKTMIHVLHWCNFTFKSVVVKLSRMSYVKNRSTSGIVSRGVSTTRDYSSHFFHWDYWSDHKVTYFFHYFSVNPSFRWIYVNFFYFPRESAITIVLVSSGFESELHTSWAVSSVLTAHYNSCPRLENESSLTFLTTSHENYFVNTDLIDNSDPFQK